MSTHYKKALICCTAGAGAILLVSCSMPRPQAEHVIKSPDREPFEIKINKVDDSAITYQAKYGIDYEIEGNVIAKYPHFDLTLFSERTHSSKQHAITIYELTSKDGFAKTHISCDTRAPEKKHFYIEELNFYYHSNNKGVINIYMPPQLLASQ